MLSSCKRGQHQEMIPFLNILAHAGAGWSEVRTKFVPVIPVGWVHDGMDLKTIKPGKYHMNIVFVNGRGPW